MCNPSTNTTTSIKESAIYIALIPFVSGTKQPALLPGPPEKPFPDAAAIKDEAVCLFGLYLPIAVTALLLYSRSVASMLFLGSLGDLPLAPGSLAIAFANITGYSVLSGLSLGMEPLCSQAFGAILSRLLSLTLRRSVLFLLAGPPRRRPQAPPPSAVRMAAT